jgi:transposase
MAWFRVSLSADEAPIVNAERESHPELQVRRKMLVLWSLHCGLKREQAAQVAGVGWATVERYVRAYRDGGTAGWRAGDSAGRIGQ